ncbi:MAG: hypothetical protein VX000_11105, partial [Myxococcota bacterium]|nr:hypothetical protein [Myxococcota bacterium]
MTWVHPPDSLLEAFMSGTLGDGDSPEAVRIALHLDACPACSARSAALDPMARGFASMDGPAVPEGLVDAVARAALAPDATPTSMMLTHAAELAVAAGLLLAATGLFVAFGSPGDVFVT